MADKNLTIEELRAKLAEAEAEKAESAAKLAEAEAEKAESAAKLAEAEKELAEAKEKAANTGKDGPDATTLAIIENEKARAKEKKMLLIPEDLDPESTNTWQCQINGKDYLVPKGVETEVPVAVYELYMQHAAAERKARENLRKALNKANGNT